MSDDGLFTPSNWLRLMGRRTLLLVAALLIAALGTALVFVYVGNVDARAREGQAAVEVWVATKEIPLGTSVAQANSDGALGIKQVAQVDVVDGALGDLEPIASQVALSTIYPGEQILLNKFGEEAEASSVFAAMPEGTLAVPVQLAEANKINTFVRPGQDVAVFVTMDGEAAAGQPFSRLLLARVKVLAVDTATVQRGPDVGGSAASSSQGEVPLLTLALTQKQSEAAFLAQEEGELYVGLLNKTSAVEPGAPTTTEQLLTTTP